MTPSTPVWAGFGRSTFGPAVDPKTALPYSWAKDGFEATRYTLATDQLDTQLDPPAHWNPDYPGIDELPPTFARSSSSPSSTPFVRFFACQEDCSNEAPDTLMPAVVASGPEPFLVVGAMAGG